MRLSISRTLPTVVLATAFLLISLPAKAQLQWFNPFTDPDPTAVQEEENQNPPAQAPPPAPKPKSLMETAVRMENRLQDMPQMEVLGPYVGNLQYKVGCADGRAYLISRDGELKLLPSNIVAGEITASGDVSEMMDKHSGNQNQAQRDAGPNGQTDQNGQNGQQIQCEQPGLLTPTVYGTQVRVVNGKATTWSAPIISEWNPSKHSDDGQVNQVNQPNQVGQSNQLNQHELGAVISKPRNGSQAKLSHFHKRDKRANQKS